MGILKSNWQLLSLTFISAGLHWLLASQLFWLVDSTLTKITAAMVTWHVDRWLHLRKRLASIWTLSAIDDKVFASIRCSLGEKKNQIKEALKLLVMVCILEP